MESNRRWVLEKRPLEGVTESCFRYVEEADQEAILPDGKILVKNIAFQCVPTLRNWLGGDDSSPYPIIPVGAPIMSPVVAEVLESKSAVFSRGDIVTFVGHWQDYEQVDPGITYVRSIKQGVDPVDSLGKYGINSLTAYFGLLHVGRVESGQVVLVSAAAGSTGSVAAQIARIVGATVVGIAGGEKKCKFLIDDIGLDYAIDYKSEDVSGRLSSLCPSGIDVFFDNVGGLILDKAIDNMCYGGSIVLCGQIAGYNTNQAPSIQDVMRVIYKSLRLEGFLLANYRPSFDSALDQIIAWESAGKLLLRQDVRSGLENLPRYFMDIFTGSTDGALVVTA